MHVERHHTGSSCNILLVFNGARLELRIRQAACGEEYSAQEFVHTCINVDGHHSCEG